MSLELYRYRTFSTCFCYGETSESSTNERSALPVAIAVLNSPKGVKEAELTLSPGLHVKLLIMRRRSVPYINSLYHGYRYLENFSLVCSSPAIIILPSLRQS